MKTTKVMATCLLATGILYSCASSYHMPESFEDKMNRFKSTAVHHNKMPEFVITPYQYVFTKKKVRNFRGLASIKEKKQINISDKKLYFMTMMTQLNEMKCFVQDQKAVEINHCPKFHNDFLRFKNRTVSSNKSCNYKLNSIPKTIDEMFKVKNPEFHLQLAQSEGDQAISVAQHLNTGSFKKSAQNETVQKAIESYAKSTHKELMELCEYGSSSNSYIFENLMSFTKDNEVISASKEGLQKLMKNPVYGNMYLLKSINKKKTHVGRGLASADKLNSLDDSKAYTTEVLARMNTHWASFYIDDMTK